LYIVTFILIFNDNLYFKILDFYIKTVYFCSVFTIQQYCLVLFYFLFRHSLKFCHLCFVFFYKLFFPLLFLLCYYYLIGLSLELRDIILFFILFPSSSFYTRTSSVLRLQSNKNHVVSVPHPFDDTLSNFYHYFVAMQLGFPKTINIWDKVLYCQNF